MGEGVLGRMVLEEGMVQGGMEMLSDAGVLGVVVMDGEGLWEEGTSLLILPLAAPHVIHPPDVSAGSPALVGASS